MEITKREILLSIAIICVMLTIGIIISGAINDSLMDKYQKYNTALQINNDKDLFEYGMRTNIGNAFVYGELKAVDTVTYPEIGGEYSYIKKVKEKYTRHTRTVTKTRTVNGKTQTYTETEVYWTWDTVNSWSEHCNKITFIDVEFDYGKIPFPSSNYITTINESATIRYKYYGSPTSCIGTIYSELKDETINNTSFYSNKTIDKTIELLKSGGEIVVFWILWIMFIVAVVAGFYYIDNRWLEDKYKYR